MNFTAALKNELIGDVETDLLSRSIYATDASVYREIPIAVVRPISVDDIERVIHFAKKSNCPIIPRAGGTSLAGQVVGNGIIVDISKHFNNIIEINQTEKWVRVEPGVILDELNLALKPYNLFFGPETSTSNRCTLGGMLGNNACGAHSLIYGSTREHVISLLGILSDGSHVEFKELSDDEFNNKLNLNNLEGDLYRNIFYHLSDKKKQDNIVFEYPDKEIKRRNTGYAIDLLLNYKPFNPKGKGFNFSTLIAGSEGTLCFITELKLNLVSLPPPNVGLVCVHLLTLENALIANLIALKYKPGAVELMDKTILDLTKGNSELSKNRWFIEGDPGAVLLVEFARNSIDEIYEITHLMETELRQENLAYAFPVIFNENTKKVWNLRKAGLGVLSNVPGDAKPVSVIEDTAVKPSYLPLYIKEFKALLEKFHLECVYHAHIGTGELHLRPILNLKKTQDVDLFYQLAFESAKLTKKFKGSLSGEHGDGRLRGQFIPLMIGDANYEILKSIKATWDPMNIFNPGKIIDTKPINHSLRYIPGSASKSFQSYFSYEDELGFIRAIEKCNGSGDCRKTQLLGGTMCPSYMATRDEKNTTRARANALREFFLFQDSKPHLSKKDIKTILDLCLSCKACKTECPSNVDMAKLKSDFFHYYYQSHLVPLRTKMIAGISVFYKIGSVFPKITNFFLGDKFFSYMLKKVLGFAKKRPLPMLAELNLKNWILQNPQELKSKIKPIGKVNLFIDEFINYSEPHVGIAAIKILTLLGYEVIIPKHVESGRAYISKGLLKKAKRIAIKNVLMLEPLVSETIPLIGIEPSAILSFKDEYLSLLNSELKTKAKKIANSCFMLDEFFEMEIKKGKISVTNFSKEPVKIKLHGHCHQRSLVGIEPTLKMLKLIQNADIELIPSSCCGMAGSFGYEAEHYNLSMDIGELVLFPSVRSTNENTYIVAPGISCRQQIKDGTGRNALHPVEILYKFLL